MRGYVIIFNHENFTTDEEKRLGTEHDVLALKNLFEKFNIYYEINTDFTFIEIATEVEKLKKVDFKDYSYFAVFILTHGDVDNYLYAKDQPYNFNLNLVDPIVDKNRTLNNKPKIFIVQACKGQNEHRYDVDTRATGTKSKITTPAKSNMCFVYSTLEGYISERDPQLGGPFIQSLCKHIDEYGTSNTIEAIMRRVTKDLIQNIYQVPMIISTLAEDFYFCEKPVYEPVLEPVARSIELEIRGYAIIFNNNTFENSSLNRFGTEPDVLALKNVFEDFNISYEIYTDFTFYQIATEVERLKKFDFKDYSYFAVIILTHGDNNNILYAKDQKYNLFDLIINPIVDNNKSLAEKPKIFIVQASKGNSHHFYERNVDAAVGKSIIAVQSKKNTFIAFSTYEGFISEQSPIIGGYFIQSLCKHINEYGSTDSIEAIMRRVTKELIEEIKQVPTIFSTLSEEFFFGEKKLFNVRKEFREFAIRGYAIIFNNNTFKINDVLALKNVFEKFNIYYKIYTDFTFYQIATEVERLKRLNFKDYSYFAVIILTHGDNNNILCANDQKYNLFELIINPIVDNNPTLVDKPKIFIIQAYKDKNSHGYFHKKLEGSPKIAIPAKSNMCFVYSTLEGFVSEREPDLGGPFIQSLCKHIDEYGTRDTIEVIMRRVTKDLIQNIYQVPMFISTLTEEFYFCEKPVYDVTRTLVNRGIITKSILKAKSTMYSKSCCEESIVCDKPDKTELSKNNAEIKSYQENRKLNFVYGDFSEKLFQPFFIIFLTLIFIIIYYYL